MPPKQVIEREKMVRAVLAALRTHQAEVAAAVKSVLAPHLAQGEKMPDVGLLIELAGRYVESEQANLHEKSEAHERELGDDAVPREQRDRAAAAVSGDLVDLRAAVETVYGTVGLKGLGVDAPVPEDPTTLAKMAEHASAALKDKNVVLPPPRRASLKLDRLQFARELDAELPKLAQALEDVAREEREAEATLAAKWTALDRVDRARVRAGGLMAALCALGGLDELATRVRPGASARRSAGDDQPTDDTTTSPTP